MVYDYQLYAYDTIIGIKSSYLNDENALDVQMAEQDNMTMLEVNIPVSSVKRNGGN